MILPELRHIAEAGCPNHYAVAMVMQCPRCRRLFEEHTMRVAKLPPVRKRDG